MMGDPRIMEVLQLALGGNVSFGNPNDTPEPPKPKEPEKKKEPEAEPEEDTSWMNEEELKKHEDKKLAKKKKEEGNEKYKAKAFDEAIGESMRGGVCTGYLSTLANPFRMPPSIFLTSRTSPSIATRFARRSPGEPLREG